MANKTILGCQLQGLYQNKTEPISLCGNYRTETPKNYMELKFK